MNLEGLFSGCNVDNIVKEMKDFFTEVKRRNTEYDQKMWGSYVYQVDGKLVLGKPKVGDRGGVAITPEKQLSEDGIGEDKVFTFIHSNPISLKLDKPKDRMIRQYFSGTDIGSEFAKALKTDKDVFLMLTYKLPTRETHTVKLIQFPGKKSIEFIKKSNPKLTDEQISSIREDGMNFEIADWYKYQDSLPKEFLSTLEV